jgi:dTMP kinase
MTFPKNPYPGLFIAIEGLDGSGSSTQINLLEKKLKSHGKKILVTKEPTENEIGKLIRSVLTKKIRVPGEALQLLFTADRSHHLKKEIIPALQKGTVVITERYFWSTIAFGSTDTDFEWLIELNKKFIQPDITFFLDVSPAVCMKRIKKSRSSTELFETEEKLKRVKKRYLKIISRFSSSVTVINGGDSIENIHKSLLKSTLEGQKSR